MKYLKGTDILNVLQLIFFFAACLVVAGMFLVIVIRTLLEDRQKRINKRKEHDLLIKKFSEEMKNDSNGFFGLSRAGNTGYSEPIP